MAIFLPGLYGGGAERTTLNLSQGIAERGYAVDLVLAQAEGPYLSEIPDSLRMVDLSQGKRLQANRTMQSLPALVRYLRYEQPETMLSVMSRANLVAIWAQHLAGGKTQSVISVRNTLSHWSQHSHDRYRRLTLLLTRQTYRWADQITAVSNGVADDLCQVMGLAREGVHVLYNPVVTPALKQKAAEPLEHPWFQPDHPPVILMVGSLTPQKDYPTALQAFAQLHTNRPLRLLILGEGSQRPMLEEQIKQLGLEEDVYLPGWVDNPYPYMKRASLFMLSSRWEGLPGVLIEALFCGVPLVATDCPSGPSEILANGNYGKLVPVGDVHALANAIESGLDTPLFPPPASWLPYRLESVVEQYIQLLFGRYACA